MCEERETLATELEEREWEIAAWLCELREVIDHTGS